MRKTMLFLLALASLTACGINGSPGNGEKIGQIVKLSKVGLFSKTWEGEIVRGGFQGGGGVNGQAFYFTVESDSLAKQVTDFMERQTEVRIHYRTEGIYAIARTESGGDFLVSIQPTSR